MENSSIVSQEEEQIELPPGFRFHPTDEELITHYLAPKVLGSGFSARAIGEADLNKCEPWELPGRAKMGEKEWYFFCVRDRKYPTGLRTNRATDAGYWKATGKDKEIFRGKTTLVGMKKTLVFYRGRAPRGQKSNWVMHEYRLEGKLSVYYNLNPKTSKNEWVICRVFNKSCGGKKTDVSVSDSPLLPPLMDSSPAQDTSHVTCFSNSLEDPNLENHAMVMPDSDMSYNKNIIPVSSSFFTAQNAAAFGHYQHYPEDSFYAAQNSILKMILDNEAQSSSLKMSSRGEISDDGGFGADISSYDDPSSSPAAADGLDCRLWNY